MKAISRCGFRCRGRCEQQRGGDLDASRLLIGMEEDAPDPLTPRQRECLEARRQHSSAKQIGRILGISHHTVHMHWRLARKRLAAPDPDPDDRVSDRHREQPGDAGVDPDLLLLFRRARKFAHGFFFWVGVLATIAYAVTTAANGLLSMAGKRVSAEPGRNCVVGKIDRDGTIPARTLGWLDKWASAAPRGSAG